MKVDVQALAELARLEITDAERAQLEKEFPALLDFVDTIQRAQVEKTSSTGLSNVMREDGEPHESSLHTKELLEAAPATKGGYVKVREVLSRRK